MDYNALYAMTNRYNFSKHNMFLMFISGTEKPIADIQLSSTMTSE